MKRKVIMSALLIATMVIGVYSAWAIAAHDSEQSVASDTRCKWHGPAGRRFARMAEVLGLNDAQKEQISAVLKSGWEKNAPLRRQMAESRKQLIKATKTTAFDEAAVRAIATNIAQIKTEMIVSRARVQNQIYALLTPEQRDLAEKLHPLMERSVHRPFPR